MTTIRVRYVKTVNPAWARLESMPGEPRVSVSYPTNVPEIRDAQEGDVLELEIRKPSQR